MARKRNKAIDYVVYLAVRLAAMIAQMLPVGTLYAVGRFLGNVVYVVDRRHRTRTTDHIRQSFPDWSDDRVRQVARSSLQSIVLLAIETLVTPRMITPASFARHVRFANIHPLIERLVAARRGVIIVGGHYGNWEVSGYTLATLGFPAAAVARPLDNPYVDRHVREVRQRTGLQILDKRGAATAVDEILTNHGAVCFIADQDAGRKGVYVDFFGRPASTYRSIALLAMRYEIPILVAYAKRLDDTFNFEIGVVGEITPAQWADKDDPVTWITQTYTRSLETLIRTDPSQYFGWAHRRWKNQPGQSRRARRTPDKKT